jgi:hypothetical protein
MDGDRVHHHAGLEFLDAADLLGLFLGLQIAVEHAEPAGLGHGDGEPRLGHRVHGGGDDRQIERDGAREPRAEVGLGRHGVRQAGLQQNVVECKRFLRQAVSETGHCQLLVRAVAGNMTARGCRESPQRVGMGR